MSAAEMLKAELSGLTPVKPDLSLPPKPISLPNADPVLTPKSLPPAVSLLKASQMSMDIPIDKNEVPGLGTRSVLENTPVEAAPTEEDADADGEPDPDAPPTINSGPVQQSPGVKRKYDEAKDDLVDNPGSDDGDTPINLPALALKVNPDGTVEQEDTIKYVTFLLLPKQLLKRLCAGCGNQAIRNVIIARNLASS